MLLESSGGLDGSDEEEGDSQTRVTESTNDGAGNKTNASGKADSSKGVKPNKKKVREEMFEKTMQEESDTCFYEMEEKRLKFEERMTEMDGGGRTETGRNCSEGKREASN